MLLSFQRPPRPSGKVLPSIQSGCRPGAGKGPISIAPQLGPRVRPLARRGLQDAASSYASGAPGAAQPSRRRRNRRRPSCTTAPSSARAVDVELVGAEQLAVDAHAALRDQPPRLRARDAESRVEHGRDVDRVAIDARRWRPRSRRASGARRARGRSAARRAAGGVGVVEAGDDRPRERALLRRAARRRPGRSIAQQLEPLAHRLVGQAHRLAEHLLRRAR